MNWIKIYTTNTEYDALFVKGILEENEISATMLNQQDTMYHFGEFKILVPEEDAIKAKEIIQDNIT